MLFEYVQDPPPPPLEPDESEVPLGRRHRRRVPRLVRAARRARVPLPGLNGLGRTRFENSTRPSGFDRQVVVTRPFVPRADVVARFVAERVQHLRRHRGARAAVAVRDHLRARLEPELGARPRPSSSPSAGRRRGSSRPGCDPAAGRTAGRRCRRTRRGVRTSRIATSPRRHAARRPRSRSPRHATDVRPRRRPTAASERVEPRSSRAGSSTPSMSRARITHGA